MTADNAHISDPDEAASREGADEAVIPPAVNAPGALPEPTEADLERFPLLLGIMETYFVRENGNLEFFAAYEERGETSVEFEGLVDELRDAIKFPRPATRVVNYALPGVDLNHLVVRQQLIEILDELEGNTADAATPRKRSAGADEDEGTVLTAEELYDAWLFRRVAPLPFGPLKAYQYPLWQIFLVGLVILLIGMALGIFIPWPGFLVWFPTALRSIGGVILGFSAVAMFIFRQSARRPEVAADERERQRRNPTNAKRAKARELDDDDDDVAPRKKAKKAGKPTMGQRITNLLG